MGRINLSTRPFYNERLVHLLLGLAALLIVGLSAFNLWQWRSLSERHARLLDIVVPAEVAQATVPLGSLTVDGVSLTVNALLSPRVVQVSLIPYTLLHTTLEDRVVGDRVHLEGDTIGKYVAAWLGRRGGNT